MSLAKISIAFIPTCWVLLFAYWTIAARKAKKVNEMRSLASRVLIRTLVILAYILLFAPWRSVPVLGFVVIPYSAPMAIIGMTVCAAGAGLAAWARHTLAGNWSGNVTFKEDHELIERGPYARVRHPIYTGLLLMFTGAAVVFGMAGNFLALITAMAMFTIKLHQEESLMMTHFPEQYSAYRKRTKRILPWVL